MYLYVVSESFYFVNVCIRGGGGKSKIEVLAAVYIGSNFFFFYGKCIFTKYCLFPVNIYVSIYIPWPFPPVCVVADNTKETTKIMYSYTYFSFFFSSFFIIPKICGHI